MGTVGGAAQRSIPGPGWPGGLCEGRVAMGIAAAIKFGLGPAGTKTTQTAPGTKFRPPSPWPAVQAPHN